MADLDELRQGHLAVAEAIDAWRIIPRALVGLYCFMIIYMVSWFMGIPTHVVTECDAGLITLLLDKGISLEMAKDTACTITGVVGGPSSQHTVLVTAICSLATGIFGFYTATGRKWNGFTYWKKDKPVEEEENTLT